jgi:hypothetical protein
MPESSAVIDLTAPWWVWDPSSAGLGDYTYRWFNLFEAAAWFVFAGLVVARWRMHRHSRLELAYAAAFAVFGLTDVAEAWQQSLPLLALKGLVLAALLWLRAVVRARWYPSSRLY